MRSTLSPWVRRLIAAAFLMVPAAAQAVPPTVASIYPLSQRVDVPVGTSITVTFDQPINPATVNDISFRVYGRWSGPASGTLSVAGGAVTFTPDTAFFAGEWITVNVSKAVQNLAAEGLAKGYAWNFWTATSAGTINLTYLGRVTCRKAGETWVQVYGAYGGDLNNDGFTDLSAPCEQTRDLRTFLNGGGTYTTFAKRPLAGSAPSPNEGADFNNDGEIDLVVTSTGSDSLTVLYGNGAGAFPTRLLLTAASSVRGVGVLDLNGDGWDDIVTANRFGDNVAILLNNGDGTFAAPVFREAGGTGEYAIGVADANNDGQLDVFVGCFGTPYPVIPMLSDGNGDLVAQPAVGGGGQPWQLVVGDFNGDHNVDVTLCNTNQTRLAIMYGNGLGGLAAPVYKATGSFPLAIDTGDMDGDGDLEIVTSNYSSGTWTIWQNAGGGNFNTSKTLVASSAGSCAVLHDRDNDGDLDLSGLDEVDDWLYIYDNQLPPTGVRTAPLRVVQRLENSPNPFNPSTVVRFDLTRPASVVLSIFDASGAFVATLAAGNFPAGANDVRWDGMDDHGNRVGSGVYFCRLSAGGENLTRKLVLLK
ncbi:MAG TPA: FG-GAP-like repeat-containing protein [Candidatus Krumholzibacteria bacterium]|nr:FG-GAP-like repeat-containing protein [Candidatus Krumholzibacteria bacterium]